MSPAESGLAFARQVLHGFSQCAFQANVVTGAFFVAAVAVANVRMAAFYVISTVLGTLAARLISANKDLLDLGLYGFNSGLMGLALANFFEPSPILWLSMAILSIVVAAVAIAMSKGLNFPYLAAPFIICFWAFWPMAKALGLEKIAFDPFTHSPIAWGPSIVSALGSALFVSSPIAGLLFLVGVAISNWRHAIVAALGAFTAVALAVQAGSVGGAVNSGFVGFNGVLAALAAYVLISPDLRFVALAAVLSTWIASYVYRGAPTPVLASGFVLSIWFMLFLAWLNPLFAGQKNNQSNG